MNPAGAAICLLIGALLYINLVVAVSSDFHWNLFKSRHGKNYTDQGEDLMRKSIFLRSKRRIELHNAELAPKLGYTKGLNRFSDWTQEELSQLNGYKIDQKQYDELMRNKFTLGEQDDDDEFSERLRALIGDDEPIPLEMDWRKVPGRVSGVKNQGQCGSCWAFATTGLLEGQEYRLKMNSTSENPIRLSEQNLVDCSKSNFGCRGGYTGRALLDINRKIGGIESESDYPYEAKDSSCRFDPKKAAMSNAVVVGYKALDPDEDLIKRIVAKFGPVAVAINANSELMEYKGGIYADDPECWKNYDYANHAVLLVGYGRDEVRGDYWIIKNSWSSDWGEAGYFRMIMHENMCAVATMAIIPMLNDRI